MGEAEKANGSRRVRETNTRTEENINIWRRCALLLLAWASLQLFLCVCDYEIGNYQDDLWGIPDLFKWCVW